MLPILGSWFATRRTFETLLGFRPCLLEHVKSLEKCAMSIHSPWMLKDDMHHLRYAKCIATKPGVYFGV